MVSMHYRGMVSFLTLLLPLMLAFLSCEWCVRTIDEPTVDERRWRIERSLS